MTDYPHFAFPIRTETVKGVTSFVMNEQDTFDDVFDCVQVIVRYAKGQRVDQPDFGVTDQVFSLRFNDALLVAEVEELEPRANVAVSAEPDRYEAMMQKVIAEISNVDQTKEP